MSMHAVAAGHSLTAQTAAEALEGHGGAMGVYHAGAASVAAPGLLRGLLALHAARCNGLAK